VDQEVAEMNDELIEDPVFNYRLRFHPQEGDLLRMDVYVDPGGGVSIPHYHPAIEERFTVLEGETTFMADRKPIVARAGDDTVVVNPGVRHSFKNTGTTEAHIACEAEPAMDLQAFLTEAAAMARAGKYTRHGLPRGFRAFLEAAEFTDRYRDSVVITARTLPPPRLQPALLGPLARLQRRRAQSSA
jgi:quercetin dioxygenase-like cupin family protein